MLAPQPITMVMEVILGFPSALTVLFKANERILNVHPSKIIPIYSFA